MDRTNLDKLTLEQLKEEARKYGLSTLGSRNALVDAIITYWEQCGTELPQQMTQMPAVNLQTTAAPGTQGSSARGETSRSTTSTEQMLSLLMQQQQQLAHMIQMIAGARRDPQQEAAHPPIRPQSANSMLSEEAGRRTTKFSYSGGSVQALSSQIPEFAGLDEDNVQAWVRRVDKVSQVNGASDGVTLLAVSSRLTKSARRWFDVQSGTAIETWVGLKGDLVKIFDRKVPFYKLMQAIDSRKWNSGKESFDRLASTQLTNSH